jgi:SWIB/MDM2 domain
MHEFCEIYGPLPREISVVDITSLVCRYIKENHLQSQEDKRLLTPDEKLARLLGTEEQINFFMLQRYLRPHYDWSITPRNFCYTYPMFVGCAFRRAPQVC